MDGKGSQKRDGRYGRHGRHGRHHDSESWRKPYDSSQQSRKQGPQQDNQQSNQQAPRQGSKQGNQQGSKQGNKQGDQQDNQQVLQQAPQQNRQQDYQPFRQPVQQPIQQPIQQQIQQPAQQSVQQPAQQPVRHLSHESSHESSPAPSSHRLSDHNHAVVKTLVEEVDALRHTIEFVGQRNVETLAKFEALKKDFSSLMQKYTSLEISFKQSVANTPGGGQILRSMEENEERRRRSARNSVAIPIATHSQSRDDIIPEEKFYIDSIIEFCYELLNHQVHVTNELREELDLATQENAELRARLQS
ncbi:hypothetical protein F5Y00DRAFT_268572 [Daldinia vernicosa]|uniref:uncharacterized protein n=1 Tax=Daldinia vernicosa TaxID=114800 RepID=UPI002007E0B0|nr:uncharacterized protein F5Y00DRAFT_268572 [Daldinia vernicosa]KAI0850040.1 hypothetical protein F5Y00DRAFT_268572 [Daldinia vernicosa]